jgi:hypothetical protein
VESPMSSLRFTRDLMRKNRTNILSEYLNDELEKVLVVYQLLAYASSKKAPFCFCLQILLPSIIF